MANNFSLQHDEKFCIFVSKDKRQTIVLTIYYIHDITHMTIGRVFVY